MTATRRKPNAALWGVREATGLVVEAEDEEDARDLHEYGITGTLIRRDAEDEPWEDVHDEVPVEGE